MNGNITITSLYILPQNFLILPVSPLVRDLLRHFNPKANLYSSETHFMEKVVKYNVFFSFCRQGFLTHQSTLVSSRHQKQSHQVCFIGLHQHQEVMMPMRYR